MEILKFYTKPACPLCDQVRDILDRAGMDWEEVNILEDPDLWESYRHEIPIVQGSKGSWFYHNGNTIPLEEWLQKCG